MTARYRRLRIMCRIAGDTHPDTWPPGLLDDMAAELARLALPEAPPKQKEPPPPPRRRPAFVGAPEFDTAHWERWRSWQQRIEEVGTRKGGEKSL